MIGRLKGILLEKQPPEILLDVQGVGYELLLPMTSFYDLPEIGQETTLFTHLVVREDAHLLFGFAQKTDRTLFRELIKTNGVGPKLALAILSAMSVEQFAYAIEREELSKLVKNDYEEIVSDDLDDLDVEMSIAKSSLSQKAATEESPQANEDQQ